MNLGKSEDLEKKYKQELGSRDECSGDRKGIKCILEDLFDKLYMQNDREELRPILSLLLKISVPPYRNLEEE